MAFGLDDLQHAGDLKTVWDNLHEKNWQGLLAAINKVREEKGNNETLDKLESASHSAEAEGHDFPNNPAELTALLQRK